MFDLGEVEHWARENNRSGERGRPSDASPELLQARLRKENALAARYELQVEREKGLLLQTIDVTTTLAHALVTFRSRVMNLGAEVSPLLEGRDRGEREKIICDRASEALTDFAGAVNALFKK